MTLEVSKITQYWAPPRKQYLPSGDTCEIKLVMLNFLRSLSQINGDID